MILYLLKWGDTIPTRDAIVKIHELVIEKIEVDNEKATIFLDSEVTKFYNSKLKRTLIIMIS